MTWSSLPRRAAPLCGIFAFAPAAAAAGPQLAVPVACDMTTTCAIQKYFDRAPGPERRDYRCGVLTTDGHDGLDIRLRRMADMARNVPVLAAAAGVVLRTRDGVADANVRASGGAGMGDRLAGNAVIIDHGGGWVTQYSHLKRGSVDVSPGDRVVAGTRIGAIGMSGNAEFAHLHFEIRHRDRPVDPFTGDSGPACGSVLSPLWNARARSTLAYRDGDVLAAGFVATKESALTARGETTPPPVPANPPALILWGTAIGAREGDEQRFTISMSGGGQIFDRTVRVAKGGLDWVGFAGMRRPDGGWRHADYVGNYTLIRNGKIIGSARTAIKIK